MIRGLYGIADATASSGDPERMAAAFLEGGCRLLQLRCKDWTPEEVLRVARPLVVRCRAVGAVLLVNDWPEVAVSANAHGVHVGQTDASAADVRRVLGPDRLLGRSTNDLAQLTEAMEHADYVAYGPVWSTPNAGRPKTVRGLEALRVAVETVGRRMPLVAIGGITASRLPEVRASGVSAWAVIGAVATADDPIAAVKALL